jgi:hypothetical protein
MYIHPPLVWGQCGDVVQLQFVDCGLVEGLDDLFGVKTCIWYIRRYSKNSKDTKKGPASGHTRKVL